MDPDVAVTYRECASLMPPSWCNVNHVKYERSSHYGRSAAASASELLDQLDQAIVLTDTDADRVLFANARGRSYLDDLGALNGQMPQLLVPIVRRLATRLSMTRSFGSLRAGPLVSPSERRYYVRATAMPDQRMLLVLRVARASNDQIDVVLAEQMGLSAREREVCFRVRAGQRHAEIARDLGVQPATVKAHLIGIFVALELRTRAELVAFLDELAARLSESSS